MLFDYFFHTSNDLRSLVTDQSETQIAQYQMITTGTLNQWQRLVDEDGFTYAAKSSTHMRGNTTWQCSRRNKKNRCRAHVLQRGDQFVPSSRSHTHRVGRRGCQLLANHVETMILDMAQENMNMAPKDIVKKVMLKVTMKNVHTLLDHVSLIRMVNRVRANVVSREMTH